MSKILLLLFVLYFSIRLIHLTVLPIFNDEAIYLDWGWRETHTPGLLYYSLYDSKPPLLMWLFGISESFFVDPLFAGRFISVLMGALTLLGIYRISRAYFNKQTAILASLVYIIVPLFVFFDRQALMESAIGAVGVWTCYNLLLMWETKKEKYAYSIGVLLGLGFFIKFSAAIYLFTFCFIMFALLFKNKQKVAIIKKFCITIGMFCLVIGLLLINPEFWSTLQRNAQYSLTLQELALFPVSIWTKNIEINSVIIFFYITPFFSFALLVGIVVLSKKGTQQQRLLLVWLVFCIIVQIFLVRISSQRYVVAYLPLCVIPAAYALHLLYVKHKVLGQIILFCTVAIPACLTIFLISKPQQFILYLSKLNPYAEVGYIVGQTSGYGIAEVKNYIDNVSKNQKILVGIANNTGNPENALNVYYEKSDHVTIGILDGRDFGPALQSTHCLRFPVPFYYVTRNTELNGLEKFLVRTKVVHTPASNYTLGIYITEPHCTGKTLDIGDEK
jgi:4-amino-4-deoxy-L-arabinose transferase-like glycosyltransferase